MEILTKENLAGAKTAPTAISRTFTLLLRDTRLPWHQRAPNPPEFAQPRLSGVNARSSLARGYKFWVCLFLYGRHEDAGVVTGHIGTNTPKFVPPRWGRPRVDPTQTGLCKFRWVWSSLILRIHFSHPESDGKSAGVWGWGSNRDPDKIQQFTYGVVREGVIAESFPQSPRNFRKLSAEFPHPFLTQ